MDEALDRGIAGGRMSTPALPDDAQLVAALRRGDESAFVSLLDAYQASMLRLARIFVVEVTIAQDVVQETWLGVLRGLAGFEGRSSLRTWIFSILINCARKRSAREGRSVPFSALGGDADDDDEPAVAPERFRPPDAAQWPGGWLAFPDSWANIPEARLLARETQMAIRQAIAALPAGQRSVIVMHDVEGWPSAEICNVLGLSETNQRVLLHRARSKVRRALEQYLQGET